MCKKKRLICKLIYTYGWGWVKLKQSYGTNMLIQTVQLTISILHVMKYKIYTRNNNIIYFLTVLLMCDYALTCVTKGKTNIRPSICLFFFKKRKRDVHTFIQVFLSLNYEKQKHFKLICVRHLILCRNTLHSRSGKNNCWCKKKESVCLWNRFTYIRKY